MLRGCLPTVFFIRLLDPGPNPTNLLLVKLL
jgi:hypothetical protein